MNRKESLTKDIITIIAAVLWIVGFTMIIIGLGWKAAVGILLFLLAHSINDEAKKL